MLVHEWAIHFPMAVVASIVGQFGSSGCVNFAEQIMTIGTGHGARRDGVRGIKGERVFLLGVAGSARFRNALLCQGGVGVGAIVVNLVATRAIDSGFEMLAGMSKIGLRFPEMALAANIKLLISADRRGIGDILRYRAIQMFFKIDMT